MPQTQRQSWHASESELFQLLVQNVADSAIYVIDPQGCVQSWNWGAEQLLGYEEGEIVGQRSDIFLVPDERSSEALQSGLRQALEAGRINVERWHVRKSGSRFWSSCTTTPLRDSDGNLRGFAQIIRDRTEEKSAEDWRISQTRESERRRRLYEAALSNTPDLVYIFDLQHRFTYANEGLLAMWGRTWDEAIGKTCLELGYEPWHAAMHDREIDQVVATKTSIKGEVPFTGTLGRRIYEYIFVPVLNDHGEVDAVAGSTRDVTERRQAEQQLAHSEHQSRTILESITDAFVALDSDWRFTYVNGQAERIYGMRRQTLIGKLFWDVFPEVIGSVFEAPYRKAMSEQTQLRIDGRYEPLDKWFEVNAFPVQGGGLAFYFRDVAEQKRAESLLVGQLGILEMIVTGAPLPDVLASVCRVIEEQEPGLLCSILLTDDEGRHTGAGFGPSLPEAFVQALKGIAIAPPYTGSCCKALDCGEEVVVCDIANDERWSPQWRDLNLSHGLRACRSIPIFGSDGTMLASVAIFRCCPGDPGPTNNRLLGFATHLAGIAIERRRAEERERRLLLQAATANAKFRAFFDQGPLFAGLMALNGTLLEANRLSLDACGYTKDQVIGQKLWECPWWNRSPDVAETIREGTAKAAIGARFRAEMPYFVADGSERLVDVIVLPIEDDSGKVVFLALTGTDITDRKRAEAAMHRQSKQLRRLADVAMRLNTTLDIASITAIVNEEARGLIGSHQAVTIFTTGSDWGQAIQAVSLSDQYAQWRGKNGKPPAAAIYSLVCSTNRSLCLTQAELAAHRAFDDIEPTGQYPPLRGWLAAPLVGRNGRNLGLIQLSDKDQGEFTSEDEAILVQLAQMASVAVENAGLVQDLRDADRRKDEFLATLAHELRNPLAPIRNALQILGMPGADAAMVEQTRHMMERQVHHLVRLVDDLLDVSRVMRGKIELRKEPVDLASVVARAVETAMPLIKAQRHLLHISALQEPLLLDADPVRLAQVVSNLLTNAAKYMEPGGQIWLTARRESGRASLSIRDAGIGIAADILPLVFDLFMQAEHASSKAQGGLGIGLTLVKNLVEMHAGTVEAHSDGLGKGSEFIISLPLSVLPENSKHHPAAAPSEKTAATAGRRLLVVDDNRDAAISLSLLLRLQGHEVRVAHDGPTAVEMATAFGPDIIFLDIGMPGMDGYEVARRVRNTPGLETTVLAALTGWGQSEDRRRTAEAGFDHHLVKPPEPLAVQNLLAELKPRTL